MPNSPVSKPDRRRFISLTAAAAALPSTALANARSFKWTGSVLGAKAEIILYAQEQEDARVAVMSVLDEVRRLEAVFSLFNNDSEISRLNANGNLAAASHDLQQVLALCRRLFETSDGLFDPTIQALWRVKADWFARYPAGDGPPPGLMRDALNLVGYDRVVVKNGAVTLGAGQALTLNGIAQGYITDKATRLLERLGWRHVLVGLGEYRANARKPDGQPFTIKLDGIPRTIALSRGALASTSAGGFVFPARSPDLHNHLFDPATGISPAHWTNVHVSHPTALIADGLATTLALAPPGKLKSIASHFRPCRVWAVAPNGKARFFTA